MSRGFFNSLTKAETQKQILSLFWAFISIRLGVFLSTAFNLLIKKVKEKDRSAKTQRIILLLFTSLLLNFYADAQKAPAIQWQKSFSSSLGDGGDNAFQQTKDTGYVEANSGADCIVTKFDKNGDVEWTMQINATTTGLIGETCDVISQTIDEGFIVGAELTVNLGKDANGIPILENFTRIVKLDKNGNKVGEKSYPSSILAYFESLKQTTDGGFIGAGSSDNANSFTIVKFDSNLNVVWQDNLGPGTADQTQQTSDDGFLVAGLSIIAKIDDNGKVEWQKNIGISDYDIYSVQPTNEGGFVYAGRTDGNSETYIDYVVVKFDNNGIEVWQKEFGGSGSDKGFSVTATLDSGYVVAGSSTSADGEVTQNFGGKDCWIVKLDQNGNLIWQKSIGGTGDETGYAIKQTVDKGYIIFIGSSDYGIVKLYPEFKISVQQPGLAMINTDGTLDSNFIIPDNADAVKGAATDGVTKLLVTVNSQVPVSFTLAGSDNGTLNNLLDQSTQTLTLSSVQPINGKATVIYTVPDGYGENQPITGRYVTVFAKSDLNDTSSVTLKLMTPPVILIHGLWSNPQVWNIKNGINSFLNNNGINKTYLVDYNSTNSQTFDPYSSESLAARNEIYKQIMLADSDAKSAGIVISQVDVIAHSMGGLQARGFSQDNRYLSPSNYNKGYFHKVITIGTPHLGSPLGGALWNSKDKIVIFPFGFVPIVTTVSQIMKTIGKPIGTGVRDLDNNSLPIKNQAKTPYFKSYAICGNYTADLSDPSTQTQTLEFNKVNVLTTIISSKPLNTLFASQCNPSTVLPNDVIVPQYSQMGNISKFHVFFGTAHSNSAETNELNNTKIEQIIDTLLLTDNNAEFSSGFPAFSINPSNCNIANNIKNTTVLDQYSGSSIIANLDAITNLSLKIINSDGLNNKLNNGKDSLTLSLQFTDPTKLANAIVNVQNIGEITVPSQPPFTVKMAIPQDVPAGRLAITALGNDINGNIYADTVSVNIQGTDTLKSITLNPNNVELDSLNRTQQLYVNGIYTNNQDSVSRDISLGQTGTTYTIPSKKTIFSVTTDGLISGLTPGTDTIIVNNNNISTKIAVTVNQSLMTVKKYNDTITLSMNNVFYGQPTVALSGKNLSGENITYKLLSGPVTLTNGTIIATGMGQGKIVATSPGDAYFNAASNDTVSFDISLPITNFKVAVTSVACRGDSNGSLKITAESSLKYTVTITGNGLNKSYPFTDSLSINNLAVGTYSICITVADQTSFQQCYNVVITQPSDLSVYTAVNTTDNDLNLSFAGGTVYKINLNGTNYTTSENTITLPLQGGDNDLVVTTDRVCQGTIEKHINLSGQITPYPVPFQNTLSFNLGIINIKNVLVQINTVTDGKMVYTNQFTNKSGVLQLNLSSLQNGIYSLHVNLDGSEKIFKIIKE